MIDFVLLDIFWYVEFQVHTVLADVHFLSDSQMSPMPGENLLK